VGLDIDNVLARDTTPKPPCKQFQSCKDFQISYKQYKSICIGCGADIQALRRVSAAADRVIDEVLNHIDHKTPEETHAIYVKKCMDMQAELAEHNIEDTLGGIANTVQYRSFLTILDLREAIKRGH
jgi:hypothetical protein